MLEAFRDRRFARGPFAALYELIAPAAVDVMSGERLVRIDRHLSEYFLFQTLWALFKSRFAAFTWREHGGFETAAILDAWQHLPPNVVRPERNKRQHLSHLLSRNEVDRDYAYNRRLFVRVGHGWYQFNPALAVRRRSPSGESWVPIFDALNLRFVAECADPYLWPRVDALFAMAGMPPMAVPIGGARAAQKIAAERERHEALRREMETMRQEAALAKVQTTVEAPPAPSSPAPAPARRRLGEPRKRGASKSSAYGSKSRRTPRSAPATATPRSRRSPGCATR